MRLATTGRFSSAAARAAVSGVLCAVATALLFTAAAAQVDPGHPKLDPILRSALLLGDVESPVAAEARAAGVDGLQNGYTVFIRGAVSAVELEALGVEVRTDLGDIKTAWIPETALADVLALPGVRQVEGCVRTEPELEVSVPATGVSSLRGAAPTFPGLNGQGIIWGDVDSGIDWTHPDFKDQAGLTRIKYLWDQTDLVGPNPSGFAYGSEWTAAQIDASLCRETDTGAHGTHVTGIGAGDGSATGNGQPAFQYVGMAPLADIIMVKTDFSTAGVVDGVNYVFQRAAALGQLAACNLSLGSHYGPHDGTSTFEQALSSLTGLGKVLVKSAGNENNSGIHAEVLANPAGVVYARLNVPNASSGANQFIAVDGYYDQLDNISVELRTPSGAIVGPVARGASFYQVVAGQGAVYIENGLTPTNSGDYQVYVELSSNGATIAAGNWDILLTAVSLGATGETDLWRFYENVPGTPRFTSGAQNEELVSEPGNALSICTVAAWTSKRYWTSIDGNSYNFTGAVNPGNLSPFSSPGPTRDGRQKPDITAPGSAIVAAKSAQAPPPAAPLVVPDGVHTVNQGTSMAAPHVTGAVALLLQNRGAITTAQASQLLANNALVDGFTGAVWNNKWGYGKLYISAPVPAVLRAVTVDVTDGVVHLAWMVGEGSVTGFRAERRILGEALYSPVSAAVREESFDGAVHYVLDDADVLPGLTYQYQLAGTDGDGQAVVFGPYVAQIPARSLAWAFARVAPNPLRGEVVFSYTAGSRGVASLSIYDARGRLVAQPLDQMVDAGPHSVAWNATADDGSRLARGVYLAVFRGGGIVAREKLLVLE